LEVEEQIIDLDVSSKDFLQEFPDVSREGVHITQDLLADIP